MSVVAIPTPAVVSRMLEGVTVLVVTEDEDTRATLDRALGQAGAVTTFARDADTALARLEGSHHDLVISDLGDACRLIRRIRARSVDCGGATPAIALAAHHDNTGYARAILAGFQAQLCKPLETMTLVMEIRRLVVARWLWR